MLYVEAECNVMSHLCYAECVLGLLASLENMYPETALLWPGKQQRHYTERHRYFLLYAYLDCGSFLKSAFFCISVPMIYTCF